MLPCTLAPSEGQQHSNRACRDVEGLFPETVWSAGSRHHLMPGKHLGLFLVPVNRCPASQKRRRGGFQGACFLTGDPDGRAGSQHSLWAGQSRSRREGPGGVEPSPPEHRGIRAPCRVPRVLAPKGWQSGWRSSSALWGPGAPQGRGGDR